MVKLDGIKWKNERVNWSLSIQIFSKECRIALDFFACQKNTLKVALGLFITHKRNRISAQAQQITAQRLILPLSGFPQIAPPLSGLPLIAWTLSGTARVSDSGCSLEYGAQRWKIALSGVFDSSFLPFSPSFLSLSPSYFTSIFNSHQNPAKQCKTSIISLKTTFDSHVTQLKSFTWF